MCVYRRIAAAAQCKIYVPDVRRARSKTVANLLCGVIKNVIFNLRRPRSAFCELCAREGTIDILVPSIHNGCFIEHTHTHTVSMGLGTGMW